MRVLITGGAGFIGSHLAEAYLQKGDEVYIIDNLSTGSLKNIEFLQKDGIIILNDYLWFPVQSTFERVKDPSLSYISLEKIKAQLEQITSQIHVINALELANQAGNPLTSNVVLLGALARLEGFPLSIAQLKSALPQAVPKKALDANLKAIDLGYKSIQ